MSNLTGVRKLMIAALLLGIGVTITYLKGDVPPGLLQLLSVIFGGFIIGNAAEHAADAHEARSDAQLEAVKVQVAAQPAQPAPGTPDIQALSQQMTVANTSLETIQQTLLMIIKKAGLG